MTNFSDARYFITAYWAGIGAAMYNGPGILNCHYTLKWTDA